MVRSREVLLDGKLALLEVFGVRDGARVVRAVSCDGKRDPGQRPDPRRLTSGCALGHAAECPVPRIGSTSVTEKGADSVSADPRNVIIIGSGPAGYTAAVYAARANLAPAGLRGLGHRRRRADEHHRGRELPRLPRRHHGPELMDEMRAQAERFGAELVTDDVIAVDLDRRRQDRAHRRHGTFTARAVILAMGSGYRKLGIPDEERLSGHGVSWCATCDGFFFRDQHIAVVGGGDSAIEEATFLSRFGSKVTLVHRRDELRASKIMQERAFADPKIEFAWNSEVAAHRRRRQADRRDAARHRHRRAAHARRDRPVHRDRPRPALGAGRAARSTLDDEGYVLVDAPVHRAPTSRASSPAATWSTTTTGRRSPRPAPAAPPRSTPSATWPPSTTPPRPAQRGRRPPPRTPPSRRAAGQRLTRPCDREQLSVGPLFTGQTSTITHR